MIKNIFVDGRICAVRQFGQERTGLTLSDKAQRFYCGTDYFRIYEAVDCESEDKYIYELLPKVFGQWKTAEEINDDLESMQDELDRLESEWD